MTNFDTARDALETSMNSAGSAMKEHEKWQQSLEAQINSLKASWQSLSQAFLSSDFLKVAFDAIIKLVDGLTKLIDTIGALPTLLGVFAGFKAITNISGFIKVFKLLGKMSAINGGTIKFAHVLGALSKVFPNASKGATTFGKAIKAMFTAMTAHPIILAITVAIGALTTAFAYQSKKAEELAEKVDELTDSYKEEHEELKKLQGDYDTSNESSMISKYERLSKGVDGLGKNVSLTTEEYSEYQSIVNQIADQIPSLVSGYDSQGNALLSCKGNVEELTTAYEKLIHAQNQEILTNTGNIEKDFVNTLDKADGDGWWSNGHGFWAGLWENIFGRQSVVGKFAGQAVDYELKNDTAQGLQDLLSATSDREKQKILKQLKSDRYSKEEIRDALEKANIDVGAFEDPVKVLEKTLKTDPQKIKNIVDNYYTQFADAVDEQKTIAQAKLSEAFDVSSAISGLDYGNISEELQTIAYQVVNSLDLDFFTKLQEQGKTVEQWTTELLNQLNTIGRTKGEYIENAFELQAQFNGGDIDYGDYIGKLKEVESVIDGLDLKDEAKTQLKISLGLDENGVVDQYDALINRLTSKEIGLNDKAARNFVDSLSAEELAVLVDIVPDLDADTTIDEIKSLINDQLAQEFKFDIEVQTKGIEALNTALTESRSAAGLTSESIATLTSRYEDLDGFNAAALFEKTANGIRLNSDELSRLEEQYVNTNKLEIDKNLNALVEKYQDVNDELKTNTSLTADERKELERSKESLADKIDELSTLASQYDGLTSAFTQWQNALNGAEEGDNYDSVFENLEAMKELDDKKLYGTDKYKTFAQLMSYEDLSSASIDKIGKAFDKGYKKAERYFTESKKGSTNFLNDLNKINSEWAHINKNGDWEVNINAEEAAKKLGISVEAVLLILDKLKDYGIKVEVEDTSVDNLQTKIQETEAKLKELGQSPVDINVDIEASSANLGKIESEIKKAKSKIAEINKSSVSPEVKTAQLEDARAKLEALIQKKQEASQPAFMNLNTSQVNASLVDALEKIKEYQNALNDLNKLQELKEAGIAIDGSEIDAAQKKIDDCARAIQGLDGDVKVAIGLEEDGSIDSIKKAFEEGKVKIDANTDPAVTKIEQLAENVERIEDKDVTINVTVNGLDQVKELNKQIDLATDIKGDIDKLSDYVENAKELNKLGNNITSYVTAEVKGNVIDTKEYKLDNLKVFGESAKEVKGLGTFTSKVTANVEGNVIDTKESKLDNLKVFTDSAKDISKIGVVKSTVTADIKGNVSDTKEYKIDNLKVFTDNAEDISKIGVVTSKVTADIDGNVIDTKEYKIDNLKIFTDSAKDVKNISNVESKVSANIEGNVINTREGKLDNLKVFTDNAKDIKKIGNVESTVKANIEGNVKDTREIKLDNLKVFTDNAKDIGKIGDVKSTVTAEVNGNVIETREGKLDNLKVFTDNAKDIKNIGNVSSKVSAEINGNVIETREGKLDNLKVFTDSAKDLKNIGSVNSDVNVDIGGNVINTKEIKLDNLKVFADGANELKNTGSFESKVVADIDGNVIDTKEMKIDNLGVFADNAKKLKDIGSFKSNVEANVNGNITDTRESKIDNLKAFYDSAKDLKDIGSFESNVKANVDGNVINTKEMKIDNLKVFSNSAKDLKSIGTVTSKVTADVDGNVLDTRENKIDNLKVYYNSAKDISKIGTVKSSVSASISGNVIDTREGKINNLKVFSDSAKDVKSVGSPTSNVTANVNGNVINTSEDKIDNLGVFATNANKLKNTGNFTSSVSANVSGNVITDNSVNSDLEHFASIVSGMSSQTVTVSVNANVDSANINNAIDLLTKVANSGVFKDYKATVQVGAKIATIDDTTVKNYQAPPKEGKVSYSVNPESSVYTWTAPSKDGVVNYSAEVEALTEGQKHKTGTITYKAKLEGFPVVNGTANANGSAFANGTSGKAFKQGDWGVKKTTTALTGELGQELVVYGNRFWTVGDNGAEFATIPKGAIVFNHKQTEELFKNGKVTSDGGRGRALANGNAFAQGTAFASGTDSETFDWFDIYITRLERCIDKLDKTVSDASKSWSSRNNALADEIRKVGQEIKDQQSGAVMYKQEAAKVGLNKSAKNMGYGDLERAVRDGNIRMQDISDESIRQKINEYKELYEKQLACEDAVEDLEEKKASLYAQRVENAAAQYEGVLGVIEHKKNMLDEYISQAEAQGHLVSEKYYNALVRNEKDTLFQLNNQKADMLAELQTAMESGTIAKGSEAYYSMIEAIDEVTLSVTQSQTAIMEYQQTIQQLKWEQFDLLQDKISAVTEEADFLIELMSNDKLFDDNGKMTDKGMSTAGLHAQNYNTYMYQAKLAAAEAERIKTQLASDLYDTELEERYREMISLQQEYILSAEGEKDAIRDLVEEGINLELDALQELIDKKNEALDSERSLYEYQNKVKEQTKEIASLEKQMAAYAGDDSEEAQQKIQQIKVDLETARQDLQETEYDKYISDTEALLDSLYEEYELILNQRLDNVDALLSDIITEINNNSSIIREVLDAEAENVNYDLSESTKSIWNSKDGETSNLTDSTNTALDTIKEGVEKAVDKMDAEANKDVSSANGSSADGSKQSNAKPVSPPPSKKDNDNSKWGSWFEKEKYQGAKKNLNPWVSIVDRLKFRDIDSSFDARAKYYKAMGGTGEYKGYSEQNTWMLREMSKHGYATGKKNFSDDKIAWTQEKGQEFIVRPSDGAILTPIAKGDSVLNAQASNNIWDMANSPTEFIKDNLKLGAANVPNNSNVNNSYIQNFENVTFSMPNVHGYSELLTEMQKDPKFEKLILSMTIDRIAGKSGLAKNKSIR